MIKIKSLSHNYMLGNVEVSALTNINLDIPKGKMIALIGPSGSGKTTLLNLIGSLDKPSFGEIEVDGINLNNMSLKEIQKYRRDTISFIFQFFNLFPTLDLKENVEFPLLFSNISKKEISSRSKEAIDMVGLKGFDTRKINELSGGQRQRIAVARAIVTQSKIVLADEPTGSLDSKTASDVMNFFKQINKHTGTTFVFSTHDPRVIEYADIVIKLKDGVVDEVLNKDKVKAKV